MADDVFVNKACVSYQVKNTSGTVIGNIVVNEIYGAALPPTPPTSGTTPCVFLSSGGRTTGTLVFDSASPWAVPGGLFKRLSDYPFGTATISGTSYKTFKARRQTTIYKPGGSEWGGVANGYRIALAKNSSGNSFSGTANKDYIAVAYVESSSGGWVQATGDGQLFCYAPIGLNYGSGAATINFITGL